MTDENQNTTEKDADAKDTAPDTMRAAMENCGCDCASMMARFFQNHPGGGAEEEKDVKKGCC
jgi:hypothetical protein